MEILPGAAASVERVEEPTLLARRMAALGLAPDVIERAEIDMFFDLQRLCSRCEYNDLCESELCGRPADLAWTDYCPNALLLNALADLSWFDAPSESRRQDR